MLLGAHKAYTGSFKTVRRKTVFAGISVDAGGTNSLPSALL